VFSRQAQHVHHPLQDSTPVILLGMHRSGTSLTTRLLTDVGILMGAKLTKNAESIYFQKLNRGILKRAKATWSKIEPIAASMESQRYIDSEVSWLHGILFDKSGVKAHFDEPSWNAICQSPDYAWGWKDPRTTITFPMWLQIFPRAKFVHIVRNGIDVAISLHRRYLVRRKWWHRFFTYHDYNAEIADFQYCFRLWEEYLTYFDNKRHLIPESQYLELRYEDLLASPGVQFARLIEFLNYAVAADLFEQVCQQINVHRLDNEKYRSNYRSDIEKMSPSALLRQYHYQ
jgi:hypothetical protein